MNNKSSLADSQEKSMVVVPLLNSITDVSQTTQKLNKTLEETKKKEENKKKQYTLWDFMKFTYPFFWKGGALIKF